MRRCTKCGRRLTRGRKFIKTNARYKDGQLIWCDPKDEKGCGGPK